MKKKLFTKIVILLMLFSIGAELSGVSFTASTTQYAVTDIDGSDKKEKDDFEKDKMLAIGSIDILTFKKQIVSDFFIPYISVAFKILPEIPPKQA
jgi:hypothetical protein